MASSNSNFPPFYFPPSNNSNHNDQSTNNSMQSLLQKIANRQIEILDRLKNIETHLKISPSSNTINNIDITQNESPFPALGRRLQPLSNTLNSVDLTDDDPNPAPKKRIKLNSPIDNFSITNFATTNTNIPVFTFPFIQTNDSNTAIWNLTLITDETDYFDIPISSLNKYNHIGEIKVKVKLPIQQIELLPTIKQEIASKYNKNWRSFHLFLKTGDVISPEDQLIKIQNNNTILVRRKQIQRNLYNIKILPPDSTRHIKVQVYDTDYIWEIKYLVFLQDNNFLPAKQRLIYGGRQLENNKTVGFYEIKDEFVLHLVKILS